MLVDWGTRSNMNSLPIRFASLFSGRAFYRAAQFLVIVLIIKLGDPELLGRYGLAQAMTAPLLAFLHLDLGKILASHSKEDDIFVPALFLQLVLLTVGTILSAGIAWLWQAELLVLTLAVALFKSTEYFGEIFLAAYLQKNKSFLLGKVLASKSVFHLFGIFLGLSLFDSLELGVLFAGLFQAFMLLFVEMPLLAIGKGFKMKPELYRQAKDLFCDALPAGARTAVSSFNTMIPRYALALFSSTATLGYYVSLTQLMQIGALVNMSMIHASFPALAQFRTVSAEVFLKAIRRLQRFSAVLGSTLFVVFLLFGESILLLLFDEDFQQHYWMALLVMAIAIVRQQIGVLSAAFLSCRLLKEELRFTLQTSLVGLATALVLIPTYGLLGAFMTLFAASLFHLSRFLRNTERLKASFSHLSSVE